MKKNYLITYGYNSMQQKRARTKTEALEILSELIAVYDNIRIQQVKVILK